VKRFPRECDHIFHIKCLEVWLKIEASCPNCLKSYLGHQYTNANLEYERVDSEKFSVFNEGTDDNEPQWFSENPFVKMHYYKQIKYMEKLKNKKSEIRQQLI
jgi:hypothetical protein